tara:strand:- start:1025 stop:1489 length:465 start_codon:yes stop_codon:yes gene_type:complete
MIKVNVILNENKWKYYLKNPNRFLKNKISLINKKNNFCKNKILIFSLLLTSTKEIKELNKRFRNKNQSTDVLSFPFYDKKLLKKIIKKDKEIYIGDVIVNLDKIKDKNDKVNFTNNFNELWIHGLIHLFGHKHKKDKDFFEMNKIEKRYFKYIN